MSEICQALREAGISDVDNLMADIFLWWVSKMTRAKEDVSSVQVTRYWKISPGKQGWAWDEFQKQGIIGINFRTPIDLRDIAPSNREELQAALKEAGDNKDVTKKEKITRKAIEILEANPEGMKFSELVSNTRKFFPEGEAYGNFTNAIWNLHSRFPELIYKPKGRGGPIRL